MNYRYLTAPFTDQLKDVTIKTARTGA